MIAVPYTSMAENVEVNRILNPNGGMAIRGIQPSQNKFDIKSALQAKFKKFEATKKK